MAADKSQYSMLNRRAAVMEQCERRREDASIMAP